MKLCQRATFLYWCGHILIWIVVTLPTVMFVSRISHPKHDQSRRLNNTKEGSENKSSLHENCFNYTEKNCQLYVNSSHTQTEVSPFVYDEEITQVISSVLFTANRSKCTSHLKRTLFNQKCIKCTTTSNQWRTTSYGGNESHEFCNNCSTLRFNSTAEARIRPHWLMDLSCLPFDKLFKEQQTKNETGKNATCSNILVKDANGTCRIPCDWSLMSRTVRNTYYGVMVLNLWIALVAALITITTLASFKLMRTFPHIVRFYILISSILYAAASLLPLRIGLAKVYCGKEKFWNENGHTSKPAIFEGAITHYFFLMFCFWSCCYVINTYLVIVKDMQSIFLNKTKYHAIQFVLCSTLPALLVGTNMAIKPPGYTALFVDRMTSVFTSPVVEYMTFTLPIQATLGIAISLLWSMIRFVRKVRKNKTTLQAIRPDDDTKSFINAEKQFTKLALLFVITVAIVLSSEVIITYENEQYIHEVEEYFQCIKESSDCQTPQVKFFFLSSVKISGPGVFCLLNFFLLFFNKDTRDVWRKWFSWIIGKLTCGRNKYPTDISTTSAKSAGSASTRARSGTVETLSSLNSLSLLNKFEISPDYFQPAINMTTLPPTSPFAKETNGQALGEQDSPCFDNSSEKGI